jgi:PIN domain nuclease of toxin-antitoxin system
MRILIDTHVFLWVAIEPDKLSLGAISDLSDRDNEIFVSAASFWEIGIKHSKGKLELPLLPREFFEREVDLRGYRVLSLEQRHAARQSELIYPDNGHRDPFDRILVAQALEEKMALLSVDTELDAYVSAGLDLRR